MAGNVTRAGVTADLEAMAEVGLGGAAVDVALPRPKDDVGFYADIAVVAFPTPAEKFELKDWSFADCIWQKIVYSWAKGSTDYVWYNLVANGCNPKDSEGGYGLMSHDFHPRHGYAAFAALAATLKGFDFVREVAEKDVPPVYVFRGERGGAPQIVLVSWNDLTDKAFDVRYSSDAKSAESVDLYGNREPVSGSVWHAPVRPSALVLNGTTRVEAQVVGFSAKRTVVEIKVGKGDVSTRKPDMFVGAKSQVFDIYQANPAEIHRMWQGPDDLSAKVWWEKTAVGVRARLLVTDDRFTTGDRVKIRYAEGEGQDATLTYALAPVHLVFN